VIVGAWSLYHAAGWGETSQPAERQPLEAGSATNPRNSPAEDLAAFSSPPTTIQALKLEASQLARRAVEEFPDDPNSHALKGSVSFHHGNSVESVRCWRKCLEQNPRLAGPHGAMSLIAWNSGQFEQAVSACRSALELDPNLPSVRLRLGRSLLKLGRAAESVSVMQRAVTALPRSSDAHFILGQGYMQLKEYDKARASFLRAVEADPNHTRAHYRLVAVSAKLGRPEEAGKYREKFSELQAADMDALQKRKRSDAALGGLADERTMTAKFFTRAASIYGNHGDLRQAEQLLIRAAVIDPDSAACRGELMSLYGRSSRQADAAALFRRLSELQPKSAVNYFFLGNVRFVQKRYDDAEGAYRKVIDLNPDRPDGYIAMVQLYLATRRKLAEARALAAKAAKLKPHPQAYFLLAVACARSGDRAAATAAIERALEMDPRNPQYRRMRESLGKGL